MKRITNLAAKIAYIVTLFTTMAAMGFIGLYLAVGPDLPEVETIRQIKIQTPMSIYSKDGQLINEFGDIRRIPITLDQVPQDFINALLSTEDSRFYQHSGVDIIGVLRAILKLATTQTKSQGASTITMLVARNYYLTREKRFSRKFTEMFVAWKLESELSKDEILEIFLNKIEWGHRSRGIAAAAQVYYGKTLNQLNLAQLATLAGIPKGQSVFNPISRPDKALIRREHVLGRMLAQGHIDQAQFDEANSQPIKTTRHGAKITVNANYIAEMVHRDLIQQFGRESAHGDGLKVFTSLNPQLQSDAQQSLRTALLEYDRRHGYRPVEQHFEITPNSEQGTPIDKNELVDKIGDFQQIGDLIPALVINVDELGADILLADGNQGRVLLKESLWARKYIDENHREYKKLKMMSQIVEVGDVIRVLATERTVEVKAVEETETEGDNNKAISGNVTVKPNNANESESETTTPIELPTAIFLLSQIPDVNAGFVVLNPQNGAVEALVGGFNFSKNQFNMVTQARRQIGSNIKPFIYSSALEKGFTAASLINDSPIINWDSSAGTFWRPENDNGRYRGPMRLREALRLSVNTVSIRLIKKIGAAYSKKYLEHIGFPGRHMQPFESLALGSASFTPLEVATGYAVLANGGFKVAPWYIERIEDSRGKILFEQQPVQVCLECIEILAEQQRQIEEAALLAEMEQQFNNNAVLTDQVSRKSKTTINNEENSDANDQQQASLDEMLLIDNNKAIQNYPLMPVAMDKIAPRVIDERNRFIIDSLLKDVIHRGTAWRNLSTAKSPLLKRSDIGGKTGTTNESKDAWFSGYNLKHVASAWVGFVDHSKKLGNREFGAKAALPIWRRFMEKTLAGTPQVSLPRPEGIVDVKIDIKNGKLASATTEKSEFEVFRIENVPTEYSEAIAENPWDHLDEKNQPKQDEEEIDLDELEL